MSILAVLLPPRGRLRAAGATVPGASAASSTTEYDYVLSTDGLGLQTQGRCAATLLPKAQSVVAIVSDHDVSWHRVTLPKAPAQRLRAALSGVLEEALLDENVHLAVAPEARPGQPTWIAAVDRSWLGGHLAALERARVFVDRVAPLSWPDEPPLGHFAEASDGSGVALSTMTLTYADPNGVATIRLQGGLARAVLPDPLPESARWTATPGAASEAGAWLGRPVTALMPAQRALQAVRSTWNLRQFELAPRNRGLRALRDVRRRLMSPAWRPVRLGAVALVLVQIVGLNVWAARQRTEVLQRQAAMGSLLRAAYPQVRAVLDAPAQMQRETDSLRAAAGRPSEADLEPMLLAAAGAWPADRPPVESLRYEPGRLTLGIAGWGNEEIEAFRANLQPAGWQVETAEGRATVTRANVAPITRGGG
jgi:general secretion pathway protein L